MKRFYGYLFLLLVVASGCATGKRALEQGNYYEAIDQAIDRLRRNPDSKKATHTLRRGYPLAVSYYKDQIRQANTSTDPFRNERVMNSYATLNRLYEAINRCPACQQIVPNAASYYQQYESAREKSAEARYQAGLAYLDPNNRERSRQAWEQFDRALNILPEYRDARQRRAMALDYATLHVVVEASPVGARRYEISNDFFINQVMEFLSSQAMNRFVRFYSAEEANRVRLEDPDHIIFLQFDDFVVGQTHIREVTEEVSRDSVLTGTVKVNGEEHDVYSTVKARVTTFTKTVISRGLLDMQVIDARTERILMQRKMPGEFAWTTQWGRFRGDERALTDQMMSICNTREAYPPPPQQMFVEFTRPIYQQATSHLRSFYSQY